MNYPTDQYGDSITTPTSKTIEIKQQEPIYAIICPICGGSTRVSGYISSYQQYPIVVCQECKGAITWVKRMMEATQLEKD